MFRRQGMAAEYQDNSNENSSISSHLTTPLV
jgi:hypothetical protein